MAPSRSSRRRFLKIAGAAGLSAAIVPSLAPLGHAAAAPSTAPPGTTPPPPAANATPPKEPSEFKDDVQAVTTVIRRRYGKHLDAKQLDAIAEELDGRMQGGKAMRAVKLGNGEEPDSVFRA